MIPLARFFRTTAFKLSLLYLVVFTVLSGMLLIYIARTSNVLMTEQVIQTVDAELNGLADQFSRGGVRGLVTAIDQRSRRPDASLYLLVDYAGNTLAGNISQLPTKILDEDDGGALRVKYERKGGSENEEHEAIVRTFKIPGGFRLLVGRDLSEQERFREVFSRALWFWVFLAAAMWLITWAFVSRRVLKRIDAMAATSRRIMGGNLSERLPVAGNGDEFDRLAISLNAMLERIELLMHGLRDVTDNIAHDLKTPLTRLLNRAEASLRDARSEAEFRDAMQDTIEDCEGLIRIFDALLRIARVESMSPETGMDRVDVSALAEEMAELYAPVCEDEGGALKLEAEPELVALGNRELVAQALVNLIENALKYGRPTDGSPLEITVSAKRDKDRIGIRVADNGPGIGREDRGRVQNRFVRLEASRTAPGYGLGLSLVKAIARLHGSSLELDDAAPGLAAGFDLLAARAEAPKQGGETGDTRDDGTRAG